MTSLEQRIAKLESEQAQVISFLGLTKKKLKSRRAQKRQEEDHAILKQILKLK